MAQPFFNRLCGSLLVRVVLVLVALCLFIFIVGRPSPSGHSHSVTKRRKIAAFVSCPKCSCDCLPDSNSISMPVDIFNSSFGDSSLSVYADCGKADPEMNKEMEKDLATLLSEEINLHKDSIRDSLERAEKSIMEVKILSSQYQKEAEKCNAGTLACEEARERAAAALVEERKLSAVWEQRARESGWNDERRL